MPNFTAGTSFTDGVTNDVTAAKLNALVADAVPTSSLSLNSTTGTIATLNSTTGTIPTLVATTLITTGTGTAAAPAIVPTGDANTGIFFPAADTIAFSEGGAEAMRIDSSGNVGIGNGSPQTNLHIGSTSNANHEALVRLNSGGATGQRAGLQFFYENGASPSARISVNASQGALEFDTANTERLRIDSSGNVGIGTASPAVKLDVSGGNILGKEILLENGAASSPGLGTTPSWYSPASGVAALSTNAAERLRIDSSGNVIIGTSTQWGVGKTTIESSDLALGLRAGSDNTALVIGKATNNSTTSQVLLQFLHNNYSNGIGQINANGANAAAFGSYSDSRLKENITELPSQLANICLLKPSEFDYKDGSGHQVGFIAQEIQQIYPDAVGEGDGGMLTVTGWSKTEARLVKAIQELKSENDTLKSRIEALEAA